MASPRTHQINPHVVAATHTETKTDNGAVRVQMSDRTIQAGLHARFVERLDYLDVAIARLEDKLAPVLAQFGDPSIKEEDDLEGSSLLACQYRGYMEQVQMLLHRVESLNRHLEV